jgi:hypothetical protein
MATIAGITPALLPGRPLDQQAVVGSSNSGNFTVYSVALGSYDLFSNLATQPGQTTLLTDPDHVQVYVDSRTLMLNSSAPVTGSALRFYGLVFNDNGILRMDCAQISDGVIP